MMHEAIMKQIARGILELAGTAAVRAGRHIITGEDYEAGYKTWAANLVTGAAAREVSRES